MTAGPVRYWGLDEQRRGAPISTFDVEIAGRWNQAGKGIFWAPNLPTAAVRRTANIVQVRYGYVDIDGCDDAAAKAAMLARLDAAPCLPCRVVETRHGFHAYWRVTGLELDAWNAVVRRRLVPYFGADIRAADPARMLRVPGFLHCKRLDDPFMVRLVRRTDEVHAAPQILDGFPEVGPARPSVAVTAGTVVDTSDILSAVGGLDARAALERLSGSTLVRGERFEFRPTRRGHWNIVVDGRPCSCFIDAHGRIGSASNGGPTAIDWIAWYWGGRRRVTTTDWRAIAAELRHLFPELAPRSVDHAA